MKMKRQLLIFCVLKYLGLTSQDKDQEIEEVFFNESISYSYNDTDDGGAPCSVNVPGFSGLGLTIILIIVFVFSMVGNSLVVYVVCCMKQSRASTDIYLMHLAMADLLFCFTLPFWAVDVYSGWIFGNFMCKLLSGFQETSVYSGVFLLACISVDRYFAIVRAKRVLSTKHMFVKVVCGVMWLVAGVLSLPVAIQRESLDYEELGQIICYENITDGSSDNWRVSLRILRHFMGFFLPLVVMLICYGWTVATLFYTRNQQKHKAMRVILAVVLAFILCWLPYNITVLIDTIMRGRPYEDCEIRYKVEMMLNVTQVLAFMHCAVNPVLYAFIGQKFRNQLLLALYKHHLISKRLLITYRKSSVNSVGSIRSRNSSLMM